ncbi:MAG: SDR family oxidoreductase [Pseudomonadota bacterium]|mgnify:CR=1 FL=1
MQTILITGANRGIGLAMTEAAVARGDRVIATARKPGEAEKLNALASLTGKIEIEPLDVGSEASCAALANRLEGRGIDLLVANAGQLNAYGKIDDPAHTEDAWRDVLMVNVFGPFATVRALLPMIERGAEKKIAIVSSIMASTEQAPGGAYAYRASKAAATNLARNLAADFAEKGIAVGAYHPGWVRTDMGGSSADIDVAESAAGLLKRFDALTMSTTGVFEDYQGVPIPY